MESPPPRHLGRSTALDRKPKRRLRRLLTTSEKARNGFLLLSVPLALELVVFKLIKFAILSGAAETARAVPQENLVTHLLIEHATVPALVLATSIFLFAILAAQLSLSGPGATALATAIWAVVSAAASRFLPGADLWFDGGFYAAVRWDLVMALGLGLGVLLALDRLRRTSRIIAVSVLHLAVMVVMLLASLDFGYFVMTGSLADSFMLRYAFTNMDNLSYVFAHELTGTKLLLLIFPMLTVSLSFVYAMGPRRPSPRSATPLGIIASATIVLLALPATSVDKSTAVLNRSTLGELVTTVAHETAIDDVAGLDLADAREPLFDAENLRLTSPTGTPNVVFIVLESQRDPDHLKRDLLFSPTPFLDRLTKKSLVVDQMFAVVPHTNKALVPILCGVFPRISQGEETHVPARCLPKLVGDLGYRSAFFTPATLSFERKDELLADMGFDDLFGDGDYDRTGFERVNYFGHEERIMLGTSMQWIEKQVADHRPFFAAFLTVTPHHPYSTPNHFATRSFGDDRPDFNSYLNAIAYVDDFLDRLMSEFDTRGLTASTIFVVIGDHGEAFGEHNLRFHSAVTYDEVLRVPSLIYAPGRITADTMVRGPRQQIDLLPTVADLVGGRLEGGSLPGVSLLSDVSISRKLFHAGWIENQSMAVRVGDRKYVYHFGRRPVELFDLSKDPMEQSPVTLDIGSEEAQKIAAELHLWRSRVNASYRGGKRAR